jgi:hypothetical protein
VKAFTNALIQGAVTKAGYLIGKGKRHLATGCTHMSDASISELRGLYI